MVLKISHNEDMDYFYFHRKLRIMCGTHVTISNLIVKTMNSNIINR